MGGWSSQRMLMAAGAAALVLALAVVYFLSQPSTSSSTSGGAVTQTAGDSSLMSPGPLPEMAVGPANAKVTIVEYASMSCPACANFHNVVYPEIKKQYVDTGMVRFIFREFPLNRIAVAASMLARCVPADRSKDLVAELFRRQEDWLVQGEQAVAKLFDTVKQAGFTKASFEKCLDDKALYDKVVAVRTRGDQQFGVRQTPTFFINGKKFNGAPTVAGLGKEIDALLK